MKNKFPCERTSPVNIVGPGGVLEAMTTWPQNIDSPVGVAIICHPDPQAEGTMHNKVVTTCAKSCDKKNYATVRFNYRGVGKSAGEYGDVDGEIDDALAVLAWVRQTLGDVPVIWLGFSFGSYIAAICASRHPAKLLVSIAPPVTRFVFKNLPPIDCPWYVIQGDKDEVVNAEEVFAWHQQRDLEEQRNLQVMSGAGHFFHGRLIELRDLLQGFLDANK